MISLKHAQQVHFPLDTQYHINDVTVTSMLTLQVVIGETGIDSSRNTTARTCKHTLREPPAFAGHLVYSVIWCLLLLSSVLEALTVISTRVCHKYQF